MTLLLVENHEQPTLSVSLSFRAGSAYDPAGKEGVAAIVAELLTKGTPTQNAEQIAAAIEVALPRFGDSFCPICAGKPLAGVLREEGHGAKRSLVCSLCLTEWNYRRLVCPACGEDRFDRLVSYTASQFEHLRVEACETCKTYMNTVDLTKNGLAIPEVDELAGLPLSLWARENGYTKLQSNLLGI